MDASSIDGILLAAIAAFFIAGIVKGTVAIGLPTAAIGILSQFVDIRLAITLAILPIVVVNAWQLFRSGNFLGSARKFAPFAVSLAVVLYITTSIAGDVPAPALVILLGVVIVLFSVVSLSFRPPRLPDRFDLPAQLLGGVAAGVLGGLTAIWAPPVLVYFLSRRVEKDEFVQATALLLVAGSVPLLIGNVLNGHLSGTTALLSAALIVPTLIGFTIGEYLRTRLNAERFRTAVLVVFLLMGLNLLRRAFF